MSNYNGMTPDMRTARDLNSIAMSLIEITKLLEKILEKQK